MPAIKVITTSWDDGHPSDLKLAEILHKYGLAGTFYVPRFNMENELMSEKELKKLSNGFEVGGHTLNHVRLNVPEVVMNEEISGCYSWLSDVRGVPPESFCFPGGIFNHLAVKAALNAGFRILRTTNLMSLSGVNARRLLPTTIQLFHHSPMTYYGHLLKRLKISDLLLLMKNYSHKGLVKTVENYIEYVSKHGGIFHLWGHSWELDEYSLWPEMELVFQVISNLDGFQYLPNSALVGLSAS